MSLATDATLGGDLADAPAPTDDARVASDGAELDAEVDDGLAAETRADAADAADVPDTAVRDLEPDRDAAPDVEDDAAVVSDAAPACDPTDPTGGLTLGVRVEDELTALAEGATKTIVHGVQGGIHLEVALALDATSESTADLVVDLRIQTRVAGVVVGGFETHGFPFERVADGRFLTTTLPVIFYTIDSAPFDGVDATLEAHVSTGDGTLERGDCRAIHLVDPTLHASDR